MQVYLLGTIFSNRVENENQGKLDLITSDDEMEIESSDDENDSLESDDDSDLMNVLNSEYDIDILQNLVEKISNRNSNQMREIKRDTQNQNIYKNPSSTNENSLVDKLTKSFQDLKEHQIILNNTKKCFQEDFEKYNELNQKLKGLKSSESEAYFNEILQQTFELGILSESYKQIDNFIRVKEKPSINHDLPFDPSNNIIILPL